MKRICLFLLLVCVCLAAVSCGEETATESTSTQSTAVSTDTSSAATEESKDSQTSQTVSENDDCGTDLIPPAFVDAVDGVLPPLTHNQGEEIDLLAGIQVMDDNGDFEPTVEITDEKKLRTLAGT